ncbi:hypothetical protein [Streptomyces sp. 900105245]
MQHRITIQPEHHTNGGPYGRYTYNWLCSCGARGYHHPNHGAAQHSAAAHLRSKGLR